MGNLAVLLLIYGLSVLIMLMFLQVWAKGLLKVHIHVFTARMCYFKINLISWWFLCSAYVKPICPMFKVGWIIDNPPDWTSCRFTIMYLGHILNIMNCWCISSHLRKITIDEVLIPLPLHLVKQNWWIANNIRIVGFWHFWRMLHSMACLT